MLEVILLAGSFHGTAGVDHRTHAGPPVIRLGSAGEEVTRLQRRLRRLGYAPGPVNGRYGSRTSAAVWAFQKANGIRPGDTVKADTWTALARPRVPRPLVPSAGGDKVEIDLSRQLMFVYKNRRLILTSHVSTGAPGRATPTGNFRVYRRAGGWYHSPLGGMYRPLFFYRGYAMHGSLSVPLHPASHGCVRLPLNVADRTARLVHLGDRVFVRR